MFNDETHYRYDARNRLIGIIDPHNGETRYVHDAIGRLQAVIDAAGKVIIKQIDYDARDNIRQKIRVARK